MKLLLIFAFVSFIAINRIDAQGFIPDPNFGQLMAMTWKRVSKTPEYNDFIQKNGNVENLALDPEWNSFFSKHWAQAEKELKNSRH
ncbi:unnamed protein product [Diamesa serratosioi]